MYFRGHSTCRVALRRWDSTPNESPVLRAFHSGSTLSDLPSAGRKSGATRPHSSLRCRLDPGTASVKITIASHFSGNRRNFRGFSTPPLGGRTLQQRPLERSHPLPLGSCRHRQMKVTLNWLKEYVDFNWSPEQLAERLTMLGIDHLTALRNSSSAIPPSRSAPRRV